MSKKLVRGSPPSSKPVTSASGSKLEDLFEAEWNSRPLRGITLTRQHEYHPTRKFRLDFAVVELKIGIELDGFGFGGIGGGHQRPGALAKDHEKANLAIEAGWILLRHNRPTLGSKAKRKAAIDQLRSIIFRRQREIDLIQRALAALEPPTVILYGDE